MKKLVHYLCKKHPTLYGVVYLLLFMLLLTAVSFLPYIYKAVAYPLFYEKQEMSGTIEEVVIQEEGVHVRHKTTDMPTYYFRINGTDVPVTPSIVREHEVGDTYDYFQYSRGDRGIGESRAYSLLWGIVGILAEIIIFWISISYFCVSTKDSTNSKKEAQERKNKPLYMVLVAVLIIMMVVVIINYVKFIYYFIYLFM